ncbi:hypothetical protein LDC_0286, partial [sediment metagenome]
GAPEIVPEQNMLFELGDVDGLARMLAEHFSAGNREALGVARARRRLAESFSDHVARKRFFSLPMVAAVPDMCMLVTGT